MKASTTFIKNLKNNAKARFLLQVLTFYALLMLLYLYFMTANLSSAPPFLYSQF